MNKAFKKGVFQIFLQNRKTNCSFMGFEVHFKADMPPKIKKMNARVLLKRLAALSSFLQDFD